jgi:protein-S-isoprenylcysteine O-methyltransferase Ste14
LNSPRTSRLVLLETLLFLLLLFFFAALEAARFSQDHRFASLLGLTQKVTVITLVLLRSEAMIVDRHPFSWLVVVVSTFGMTFFQTPLRSEDTIFGAADLVRSGASLWMIVSLVSLGKNFGMLPAYRGVSQRGTYKIVRHPYYLGAIVIYCCELALRFSLKSVIFFLLAQAAIFWRLRREETLLSQQPEYQEYCKRVPYRLFYRLY